MKPVWLTFLIVAATLGSSSASFAQYANGVPATLLRKFDRGVNITRWFCYQPNFTDQEHLRSYLVDEDYATFRKLGVHFVRLCLSPEAIDANGRLNETVVPFVDAGLEGLTKAGLAVIYDLHDNGQLKLDAPGAKNEGFVSFWEDAARHYKGRFETSVVFELANEPQFQSNAADWYALQERTVRAVRAIDPNRTIMVSGTSWSSIDTMTSMTPLPQSNLIYTFHCYDPFFFTHQGASWVGDQPKLFKSVPFPSSPEAVATILDKNESQFKGPLEWYGNQKFDASYLRGRMAKAMDWGREHRVPVVLGEFGAYPPVSPVESRTRWFRAMGSAFAELHVPNALWGYDDALGLGRERQGDSLKLDPVVLKALYGQ